MTIYDRDSIELGTRVRVALREENETTAVVRKIVIKGRAVNAGYSLIPPIGALTYAPEPVSLLPASVVIGGYPCPECGSVFDDKYDALECCAYSCGECGDTYKYQGDAINCCSQSYCHECGEEYACCRECGCDYCDNTGDRYLGDDKDSTNEHDVAKRRGLDKTANLAGACADYYLLQSMNPNANIPVYQALRKLSNHIAPQLATYLDMAIGGELRHALLSMSEREKSDCPIIRRDRKRSRGLAWTDWLSWRTRADRCKLAVHMFKGGAQWKGGFGGTRWRMMASTLALADEMDNVGWLDRAWNLQHNGGTAFDKLWDTHELQYSVLPAHGEDNYQTLLKFASEDVAEMFRSQNGRD